MSLMAAALWATGAQLMFMWVLTFMMMLRESAGYDLVGRIFCQVAGYTLVLYLLLRAHGPDTRISEFVALRRSNPWFYPLALVMGLSATLPTYFVLTQIEAVYPPAEQLFVWTDVFYKLSMAERVMVAAGTIGLGPFVEELIFRGALFRPLRQKYGPATVIIGTAVLFAAVHLDLQRYLPLLLMGLLLGYVRWASGSLLPPLVLHMGFNTVPFIDLFRYDAPPPPDAPNDVSPTLIVGSLVVCVVAWVLTRMLARHSRRAASARRRKD